MASYKRYYQKFVLIALICTLLAPVVVIPSVKADNYFIKHTKVKGHFDAGDNVPFLWWTIYVEGLDWQMVVAADIWYSDALGGWFFTNAEWYFPMFDTSNGYSWQGSYIENSKKLAGGLYIYEISQTIYGKLYHGSSYRWLWFKLVLSPGNGNGVGSVTYTFGAGNWNPIVHESVYETSEYFSFIMETDPGHIPG